MSASPSATTEKRLRADARRNRERIVDAARQVFAEKGAEAQMDDIARAAGVGVGTVYRHFPRKQALIGEVVAARLRAFTENAEHALSLEDPWEAFAGLLRANAELCAGDRGTQHAFAVGPAGWPLADLARLNEVAERVVRRAQGNGSLRADFSVREIPMLMTGVAATMTGDFDWRRHLEIVLDGLRARV